MVMPVTPMPLSASFTSSTREGRMIASIFFISAALPQSAHSRALFVAPALLARGADVLAGHQSSEHVGVLGVLRQIQATDLVLLAARSAPRISRHLAAVCWAECKARTIVVLRRSEGALLKESKFVRHPCPNDAISRRKCRYSQDGREADGTDPFEGSRRAPGRGKPGRRAGSYENVRLGDIPYIFVRMVVKGFRRC